MKFTLSWLKDHLETTATGPEIVAAMTMAGLEVEHVIDPATKLAAVHGLPRSSRPCSIPTPTACASARSTPSTAARRSSAARRTPAWA
jgi:hypothetical protein